MSLITYWGVFLLKKILDWCLKNSKIIVVIRNCIVGWDFNNFVPLLMRYRSGTMRILELA